MNQDQYLNNGGARIGRGESLQPESCPETERGREERAKECGKEESNQIKKKKRVIIYQLSGPVVPFDLAESRPPAFWCGGRPPGRVSLPVLGCEEESR